MKILFSLSVIILSFSVYSKPSIVYGDDDRIEYFQANPFYKKLARSTAAMFNKTSLSNRKDHYEIFSANLEAHGICPTERFIDQPAAASCSGFLVSDNLIVTAGHCVMSKIDCEDYVWVFDYQVNYEGEKVSKIDKKNVYSCKNIIEKKFNFFSKNDYAVIQLDRKVTDRGSLNYRLKGKVSKGTPLVVMGYPNGLPLKIADNANVKKNKWKHFLANLDAFSINSGSAVLNANTGIVEGILVGGGKDYIEKGQCKVVNQVSQDEGKGEQVSYITNIKYLKNLLKVVEN